MLGRLLEGLEQRIERRRREHVDLIDDVELVARPDRRIPHAVDDLLTDVVDTRTRRGVELVDVRMLASRDEPALLARTIRQVSLSLLAHQCLRQKTGHRGLAGAARSTEEIGVAGTALEHGTLERPHHMGLTDDV